jgi:energy-coupling factor transport system substrate-specific component
MASFLILAAVLVGGFAWYERSRPPSQVVALVAALAALAIAGRIAFAAFPNVKPTTDIVIFAGYALGPAAGFAVGALAALVSNFWFGQGPWTPWQMAGWGMCGILGAVLALGGRNVGRLWLAATCGLAGILYGALLNFSLMATYGGDLSLQRFGVLEARALPFEAAHVAGNVAFALLAGPAMVRMLIRFRDRFEWDRGPHRAAAGGGLRPGLRGGTFAGLLLIALVLAALAPAPAGASEVSRAAGWLQTRQNADGGFGVSREADSGMATTCWVMLGLEAAGVHPLDVFSPRGHTPVDYLRRHVGEVESPGDLARTIVALDGAGIDPRHFADTNLVASLLARRRDNGSFEGWPNTTAFAVIALRTAEATGGLERTLSWLNEVQNEDGGWGDVPGSPSTADGTGAVMQALAPDSKAARRGLAYLRDSQRSGGGFSLGGNGPVNTQSTAWAIQGILAVGADPDSFRRGGASAVDYLNAHQEKDGHYRYSGASDQTPIWVTGEVLVAAAGDYFPIAAPPREPQPPPAPKTQLESAPGPTVPPSLIAPPPASPPSVPLPAPPPGSGGRAGGGVPAVPPATGATPGVPVAPGVPPSGIPGAEPVPGEPEIPTAPYETPTAESEAPAQDEEESDPAGAIVLGALAGCLLFAAGLAGRRGWLRWRYGL